MSVFGLFCFLMTAMLFFGGCAAFTIMLCTGGGRRVLRFFGLFLLAGIVGFVILRAYAYQRHERVMTAAMIKSAETRQAELEAKLELEAAQRVNQRLLDETVAEIDPRPASVTLELRLHADRLQEVASTPAAITAIVAQILATSDGDGDNKQDLAGVPLEDLLKLEVAFDDEHRATLADIVQVGRRRVIGEERPEDTIHIRLDGVEPKEVETLLDQAAQLVERTLAAADDPIRSLVNVERDHDGHGFSIRVPARDVRRIAAQLMLPAALEATTVTPPVELGEIAAAETTAVELVEAASAPPEKEIIAEATSEPDLSSSTSLDDTRSVVAVEDDRTRPDWVGVGEERLPNGVFRMTSTAGPYSSTEECFQTIAGQTQGIVIRYVGRLLGSEAAAQLKVPQGFVESALIKDQWIGEVESATLGTTMYEMHVLVEFDDAARRQLELMWHQAQIQERLAMTGAASGLVLLLLGTTFGYLKLDTATRGFYSGRLKLAAGAIAAAATAALAGVLGVL